MKFLPECDCGKRSYPTKQSAVAVMKKSKGKAGKRAYKCANGNWHVTSQLLNQMSLSDTERNIIHALRNLRKMCNLPKKDKTKSDKCRSAQQELGRLLSGYLKDVK